MDILSKISKRLKDLMNEAELNIPALAKRTRLDASVISRILTCERMPSYKTFIKIIDCFNCPADYLLGRTDIWNEQKFKACPPFNEQLDFILNYFNISKYRLEKITGINEETVNRWHKGKYDPALENIIELAKNLECSVDFILGRTDY